MTHAERKGNYGMMALQERRNNLAIWWFPREFCQSHYGKYHQSGTNSCTLISLILADKVSKMQNGGFLQNSNDLPRRAVELFGIAINEGNYVYRRCFTNGSTTRNSQNLNIPDALESLRKQSSLDFRLREWFYTHLQANTDNLAYARSVAQRLTQIFSAGLEFFQKQTLRRSVRPNNNSPFLCAALIGDSRTVSFVFDLPARTIAVFDSHQHGHKAGALVAMSAIRHMTELMQWFVEMQFEVYSSKPKIFEISFLTTIVDGLTTPMNVL